MKHTRIFDTLKARVTVPQAAAHYGVRIGQNGMCCCPFHSDKTPSMKINETYFYCFGCHSTGDVIDFTARLFNLSPLDAARKLASDFGIDPNTPASAAVALTVLPVSSPSSEDEVLVSPFPASSANAYRLPVENTIKTTRHIAAKRPIPALYRFFIQSLPFGSPAVPGRVK